MASLKITFSWNLSVWGSNQSLQGVMFFSWDQCWQVLQGGCLKGSTHGPGQYDHWYVNSDLRRSRSTSSGSDTSLHSTPTLVSATSSSGYKPYIERLKAPVFSGRVEDWPEFRCVWKQLLTEYLRNHACRAFQGQHSGFRCQTHSWSWNYGGNLAQTRESIRGWGH